MKRYAQPLLFFGGCTLVCLVGLIATAAGALPDPGPDALVAAVGGIGVCGYATFRCVQAIFRDEDDE